MGLAPGRTSSRRTPTPTRCSARGLQIYATKRVFFRLGAGLGRLSRAATRRAARNGHEPPSTPTLLGVAGHGGVGVEFFQMQHLAFDAEFMTTFNKIVGYRDNSMFMNLSLMAGIHVVLGPRPAPA